MLIKDAEVNGHRVDLRLTERIVEIGHALRAGDDVVIGAGGGAALPGLHDHHVHLFATAVAADSVVCDSLGPDNARGLRALLREAPGTDWIRAVGYHESVAGDLDGAALDQLCADRPVRVQHSSGKLWIVNSAAAERLRVPHALDQAGVERDARGRPTGRLFRMDAWLQRTLAETSPPDLTALSAELASYGVTGVTDASYTNTAATADAYARAGARGELSQGLYLLGDESLAAGPLKIMLDEDDLPDLDALTARIRRAHEADRGAALHCVSHVELLVALSAVAAAGAHADDRIEHAAVVRAELLQQLVDSGATVITQPGFIADRGARYLREAEPADLPFLYPYASLLAAGVPVAASSDAPYGPLHPWLVMDAAVRRRTETRQLLGASERVTPGEALRGYLSTPQAPGGAARRLEVGAPADLCVLACGYADALHDLAQVRVRHTIAAGRLIYSSEPSTSSLCSPR